MLLDERYKDRPDAVLTERTSDGHPQVWLLYRPEPWEPGGIDEREMSLWVRRCDVFSSRINAMAFLDNLIGAQVKWRNYGQTTGFFFELWEGRLGAHRWWLTSAPVDPPGGSG